MLERKGYRATYIFLYILDISLEILLFNNIFLNHAVQLDIKLKKAK